MTNFNFVQQQFKTYQTGFQKGNTGVFYTQKSHTCSFFGVPNDRKVK